MNVIIITGAAGGIGKEFLKLLKDESGIDEFWVVGRTEGKLLKLKEEFGDKIVPVTVDLTKDEDLLGFQDYLKEKNPTIKWLINCAGTRALYKKDVSLPRMLATIRTNCVGNIAMCYACIPYIGRGDHILNVASAAAFQPLPSNNSYAASKTAMKFFSLGLRTELKSRGIQVTCSCPAWVSTELMTFEPDEIVPIKKLPGVTTADRVAKKSLRQARRGKAIVFPTLKCHVDYYITKLAPHFFIQWYAAHVEADNFKEFIESGIIT